MDKKLSLLNELAELLDINVFYDISLNIITEYNVNLQAAKRHQEYLEQKGFEFRPHATQEGWVESTPSMIQPIACRITIIN